MRCHHANRHVWTAAGCAARPSRRSEGEIMARPSTSSRAVFAFVLALASTGPLAGPALGGIFQGAEVSEFTRPGDVLRVRSIQIVSDLDADRVPTGTIH